MTIDVPDLLILSRIPGVGATRLRALVSHYRDTRLIARASARELAAIKGIDNKTASAIADWFREGRSAETLHYVDNQLSRLTKANARIITYWEGLYPENLKKTYDPPPFLFVRGTLDQTDNYSLAVVGTRSPSAYGAQMAERFSRDLSALGVPIVSGLARGVDSIAHAACVQQGNRTLAVLGSGVDVIYPAENKSLADRVIERGAVISEFEMGVMPDACNFPRRNRIISGIALATLVIESGIEGGAMITARTTLDQHKDLFVVPSAVSERRRSGSNLLIKQGKALLVERVEDLLSHLGHRLKPVLKPADERKTQPPPLSLFEQRLLEALGDEPLHIDVIAERAGLAPSDALVHLLSLEFKLIVRQIPGKLFVKLP